MIIKMIRPDSKGRIALGHLANGVSGFAVIESNEHRIVLEPYSEIPAHEKWLFKNKSAMKKVIQGLQDAEAGRFIEKDSFASFLEDSDDAI